MRDVNKRSRLWLLQKLAKVSYHVIIHRRRFSDVWSLLGWLNIGFKPLISRNLDQRLNQSATQRSSLMVCSFRGFDVEIGQAIHAIGFLAPNVAGALKANS